MPQHVRSHTHPASATVPMSAPSELEPELHENGSELLSAFRTHYYRFEQAVHEASAVLADSNVLARLGDDLDEFSGLVTQVCAVILLYPSEILPLAYFSMQLFWILQSSLYCRQIL